MKDLFFVPCSENENDIAETVLIEVDVSRINGANSPGADALVIALRRPDYAGIRGPERGTEVVTLGFPNETCEVDYEEETIFSGGRIVTGAYHEYSKALQHHLINTDATELTSFSGISGGPVFVTGRMDNRDYISFAGMAVRASADHGLIRYIDRKAVFAALDAKIDFGDEG